VRTPSIALALIVALTGCPSNGTGPVDPTPTALGIVVQPAATAASGLVLAQQPVVQLRDAQGQPVSRSGVLVTASLAVGTGTLTGTVGVRTDAEGKAIWTDLAIAGAAGSRTLRFDAAGLAGVVASPTQLGAGAPAALAYVAGNTQVAAAGTAPAILPKVRVTDASGNPVPGASVTFEVAQGGGAVSGGVAVTAADGTASPAAWTLGPVVGPNSLTAYLTAEPGTAFTFTATGIVGPAAELQVVEGNNQTTTIGTPVPTPPGVKVVDAFGNPVPGVAVTFAPDATSGSVTGATATSNASGIARVGSWTLGFLPGANTLTASRTGVPSVSIAATGISLAVAFLGAGEANNCAVLSAGDTRCWGSNSNGQLGDGTVTPRTLPVPVSGGQVFTSVTSGSVHSCGLTAAGAAWCWGFNASGQLGDGTLIDRQVPVAVQGGHSFTQLAAGSQHTCGVRADQVVLCWGSNANGRLGNGTQTSSPVPVAVASGTYTTISTSTGGHTCGIQPDQTLWCWGQNGAGRLGDGTTVDRLVPTQVLGGFLWVAVAAGGAHTCAVATTNSAYCWGTGGAGQLGTGSATNQSTPVPVTGSLALAAISAGTSHTCAVTTAQVGWCWGEGGLGRLGNGAQSNQLAPVEVSGGFAWQVIRSGGQHTCGVTTGGSALCWGRNAEGQVGDGTNTARLTPVAVKPATP